MNAQQRTEFKKLTYFFLSLRSATLLKPSGLKKIAKN